MSNLILTNNSASSAAGRFTCSDQSNIVIDVSGSSVTNWDGTNFGWDPSELLASKDSFLDYPIHQINREHYGFNQFLTNPVFSENWCEQWAPVYSSNDNSCPYPGAELREFWLTWDSTWIYCAVKGEAKGRENNFLILFDRDDSIGVTQFSRMNSGWKRNIITSGWNPDFYIGTWNQSYTYLIGGSQIFRSPSTNACTMVQSITTQPFTNTNFSLVYYINGDVSNYTYIYRIKIQMFTNLLASSLSMKIKVAVLSTGPDDGTPVLDSIPDTIDGWNFLDFNKRMDNYFILPFTDSAGNVLTNVRPRYDAQVVTLPGSI